MLEEMGERAARSTVAAVLADVLSMQEDDVEAERFVAISRETAADVRCRGRRCSGDGRSRE